MGKSTLLRQLLPEARLRGAVMVTGRVARDGEPRAVRPVGRARAARCTSSGWRPCASGRCSSDSCPRCGPIRRPRTLPPLDADAGASAHAGDRRVPARGERGPSDRARAGGHALGRCGELGRAGARARAAHDRADLHRAHRAQRGSGVRHGARAATAALARRAHARAAARAAHRGRGARVAEGRAAPRRARRRPARLRAAPHRGQPVPRHAAHARARRGERVQLQRRGVGVDAARVADAAGGHVGPGGATAQPAARRRRCASSSRPRRSDGMFPIALLADAASVSIDAVLDAIDSATGGLGARADARREGRHLPVRARPARRRGARIGESGATAAHPRARRGPARDARRRTRWIASRRSMRAAANAAKAYAWCTRAASRALSLHALDVATEFLQLALQHATDDEERFVVHDELARAAELAGRWAEVERSCDAMLAMPASTEDAARALPVQQRRLQARLRLGSRRARDGARVPRAAGGRRRVSATSPDVVRVRSLLVQTLQRLGRVDEAIGIAEESLGQAEAMRRRGGDRPRRCIAWRTRCSRRGRRMRWSCCCGSSRSRGIARTRCWRRAPSSCSASRARARATISPRSRRSALALRHRARGAGARRGGRRRR